MLCKQKVNRSFITLWTSEFNVYYRLNWMRIRERKKCHCHLESKTRTLKLARPNGPKWGGALAVTWLLIGGGGGSCVVEVGENRSIYYGPEVMLITWTSALLPLPPFNSHHGQPNLPLGITYILCIYNLQGRTVSCIGEGGGQSHRLMRWFKNHT